MSKQFQMKSKTMFTASVKNLKLNAKQQSTVDAIIAQLHKTIATNDEIRAACVTLFSQKYAPYYIYRNCAIRTKDKRFDLSKLSNVVVTDKTAKRESRRARREHVDVIDTSAKLIEAHDSALDASLDACEQRLNESSCDIDASEVSDDIASEVSEA